MLPTECSFTGCTSTEEQGQQSATTLFFDKTSPLKQLSSDASQRQTCVTHTSACAQVFQGVLLAAADRFDKTSGPGAKFGGNVSNQAGYLLGLWAHESQRTFCDKMITLQDKAWVDGAIRDICKCVCTMHQLLVSLSLHLLRACLQWF